MTNVFADVARFMESCGLKMDGSDQDQAALYRKLIEEEYEEYLRAEREEDDADAVIDLIYVLIGYGISRGWPMARLWEEVQTANMTKVDPVTGRVRRRGDGKILKPEGWKPPDIARVLKEHEVQRAAERAMLGR